MPFFLFSPLHSGETREKTVKHCCQRGFTAIGSLALTVVSQMNSFSGNLEQQGKQVNTTCYQDAEWHTHITSLHS